MDVRHCLVCESQGHHNLMSSSSLLSSIFQISSASFHLGGRGMIRHFCSPTLHQYLLYTSKDVLNSISENLLQMAATEPNHTLLSSSNVNARILPSMLSIDSVWVDRQLSVSFILPA